MSDNGLQNQSRLKQRNQLVLDHLHLIKHILYRLLVKVPNSLGKEDLMGVGALGLLDAANRFDETQGVKFASFAQKRIRGAIYDELRRHSLGGQRICKLAKDIEKCISKKQNETGKVPTDGYTYDDSKSVIDGKFCGLAIDEDNESELTDQRLQAWVQQINAES